MFESGRNHLGERHWHCYRPGDLEGSATMRAIQVKIMYNQVAIGCAERLREVEEFGIARSYAGVPKEYTRLGIRV